MDFSMTCRCRVGLAVALALIPLAALSLDFPENIGDIALRDVMWQDLPEQVRAVFVDPRDRVWYQLDYPAQKEDLSAVRAVIVREFAKPAPQLWGAAPALFEPGGRVWFVTHSRTVLLGYDGNEMVERVADKEHFFCGNCPNHGRVNRAGANLFAAGTAFFVESHGVFTFTKGQWAYQQMSALPPAQRPGQRYPVLSIEQDGTSVTALMQEEDTTSLWRWQKGTWSKMPLPAFVDPKSLTAVAPWQEGVWLFTKDDAVYHSYRHDVAADFARHLQNLGDESHKVREEATRAMMRLGVSVLPAATEALKTTQDPEVSTRLKAVIAVLTPAPGRRVTFGSYQLLQPQLALYDGNATVYITAADIVQDGKALGPGLVVGEKDGTIRAICGAEVSLRRDTNYSEASGPLVQESAKRVWFPRGFFGEGAMRLDLNEKKAALPLPDSRVFWLHALKADGTMFAGWRDPTQLQSGPIMVFKPTARDDRNVLLSERLEIADGEYVCVGSDGCVWANVAGRGVLRFNGKAWAEVAAATQRDICFLLPGNEGSVLITRGDACSLAIGDSVVQADSLKSLISDHAKEIVRLFKGGADAKWLSVVPDSGGNIWLRDGRQLSVLVNGRWREADEPLKAAGSRTGEVEYLGLCGKGNRVYMSDFMMFHDRGQSLFGEVKDGEPVFSPAPHTTQKEFMDRTVFDDSGALWIPANIQHASAYGAYIYIPASVQSASTDGICDIVTGQLALRLTVEGTVEKLTNSGWPVLKDEGGNIWLGNIRDQSNSRFNIWRGNQIVQTLTVPGVVDARHLVSDRPGSVYAWSATRGLRHLVVADAAKPGAYELGKLHAVKDFEGIEQRVMFSRLGFLAITTYSDRSGSRKHYLYIIRLPDGSPSE